MPFLLSMPLTCFEREEEEEKALRHIITEILTLCKFTQSLNLVYYGVVWLDLKCGLRNTLAAV